MNNKLRIEQTYKLDAKRHKNGTFSGRWRCLICGATDTSSYVSIDKEGEDRVMTRPAEAHARAKHADLIEE
jgi:hypothetical protein